MSISVISVAATNLYNRTASLPALNLGGDGTGDHIEATGILPALPFSQLSSLIVNLSTTGWRPQHYGQSNLGG